MSWAANGSSPLLPNSRPFEPEIAMTAINADWTPLFRELHSQRQQAAMAGWRLPVWLALPLTEAAQVISLLWAEIPQHQRVFWLGATVPSEGPNVTLVRQKSQLLGSECDVLVINAFDGLDWDLLAASAGTVKAGGLWLLLTPPEHEWQTWPNPAAKRWLSYPFQQAPSFGNFLRFWHSHNAPNWFHWHQQGLVRTLQLPAMSLAAAPSATAAVTLDWPYRSPCQQQAVAAIHQVLSGHRRRPLLLTAHRGRGKSAALGIAAAQLQQQGKTRLVITATRPEAAAVALAQATQLWSQLAKSQSSVQPEVALTFWPLDRLLAEKPALDLLLIDEAAAVPAPQLQALVQHYSRVVLASTEHGYEGTGRSFQLKFQSFLQQQCPGWRKLVLQQPIRYQAADPLEQLIFQRFLLATPEQPTEQPPLQTQSSAAASSHPECQYISQSQLLQQPNLLRACFALLSLAHYQTDVLDLVALLENPSLQLFVLQRQQQLLGCAVVSCEGALPADLCQQIYRGERRVQGHLLAQSLSFHLACPELAQLPLARVQRIVICPELHQQGLGSLLLQQLQQHYQQQGFALLGTSFGATVPLYRFWQQQGLSLLKVSPQLDASSAEVSVLMAQTLQPHLQPFIQSLNQQCQAQLYWQLATSQRQLAPALALLWAQPPSTPLTTSDVQQLQLFACGQRPYAQVEVLLLQWLHQHIQQLPQHEAELWLKLLWQKHSMTELCQAGVAKGKAALQQLLQQSFSTWAKQYPTSAQ
jgi:tRNA(Met) cytidine acetyltransferase